MFACLRFRRAWLIEWKPGAAHTTYFGGRAFAWPWTPDRKEAIRFAGKADADAVIHLLGPTWPDGTPKELIAVEHAWVK